MRYAELRCFAAEISRAVENDREKLRAIRWPRRLLRECPAQVQEVRLRKENLRDFPTVVGFT